MKQHVQYPSDQMVALDASAWVWGPSFDGALRYSHT